jgi:hypothetical protein
MYRKRHKRGKRLASVFLTVAMITAAVPAQAAEFSTPDSFEQIFSSGISIVIGTVIGSLASKMFVPLVQIFYASTDQAIPLEVVNETLDMVRLFSIIGIVIVVCMVVLGKLISKINISQALKLGED